MTDYTYNYNKIPSALAQRQALSAEDKPKARPKGIASKPSGEASATGEPDFYDRMLDMLLPYFSSKEDADEVLSNGTPDREALKLASINEFEGLSQEARDAIEQAQQTRIGPADRGDVDVFEEDVITEEAKPKPLVDPKDIAPDLQIMDPEGVTASDFPARPPLEGETTADTGAGLMSKPYDELPYSTGIVEGSTKEVLLETQSRLKELGFYGNEVDGVTGPATKSAIKTFQHKNGLEVTGTTDEQTRLKLAESKGLIEQEKPQTTLLSFISKGEGGYGAANNGTSKLAKKFSMSDGYYSDTYNKPLTEMTVNEIMNAQVGTTGRTSNYVEGCRTRCNRR